MPKENQDFVLIRCIWSSLFYGDRMYILRYPRHTRASILRPRWRADTIIYHNGWHCGKWDIRLASCSMLRLWCSRISRGYDGCELCVCCNPACPADKESWTISSAMEPTISNSGVLWGILGCCDTSHLPPLVPFSIANDECLDVTTTVTGIREQFWVCILFCTPCIFKSSRSSVGNSTSYCQSKPGHCGRLSLINPSVEPGHELGNPQEPEARGGYWT